MTLGIRALSHYLPGAPVSNQSVVAEHGFDEAFIRDKLGIQSRHIGTCYHMFLRAISVKDYMVILSG